MYPIIYQKLKEYGRVRSALILRGDHAGSRCVLSGGGEILQEEGEADWTPFLPEIRAMEAPGVFRAAGREILVEVFQECPHLVILGGGHIARPLAFMGKLLGFHVTVVDDRKEYVSRERFPQADRRIFCSYSRLGEQLPVFENGYYVIVTHGHAGDAECVRQLLGRSAVYLGMIGSRRKVELTWTMLKKEGFTEEALRAVHAPIGLPLGGNTPEEIAVSILAEILQVKNARGPAVTDCAALEAFEKEQSGVMMTIVKKSGSSPRGVGSRMFCSDGGNIYGSIGGGMAEFEALKHARNVKSFEIVSCDLSHGGGSSSGMICGGQIEILFERVCYRN